MADASNPHDRIFPAASKPCPAETLSAEYTALRAEYTALHAEATVLAGELGDLAQRAAVYHSIYRASGGNHAFPLIAAHGALWAGGQFRAGMKLGRLLAWQYIWSATTRSHKLALLANFRDALREVNRRVCVDTYTEFHFTARYSGHPALAKYVPARLLHALETMHAARRRGRSLTDSQRREVFAAHFLNEQETIVGEMVRTAAAAFNWPLVRWMALRPWVRFAYLPGDTELRFRNFADQQERIDNGLRAFDQAAAVGWPRVEQALCDYAVLPNSYAQDAAGYFDRLKEHVAGAIRSRQAAAMPA